MNHNSRSENNSTARRLLAMIGKPMRRRMRADPILSSTFIIVILVTAAAVAAVPMILTRVGERGLFEALDSALVIQRGINVELEGRLPAPDDDPLGPVETRGVNYRESLPDTIRSVIDETHWVVDSARHHHLYEDLTIPSGPVERYFQLRYQSGLGDRVELIEGRQPAEAEPIQLSDAASLPEGREDEIVPRFEILIGSGTAEIMGLEIGSRVVILADRNDRLSRTAPREYFQRYIALEVVGVFQEFERDADFWYRETRTFETTVSATPDQTIYYSIGIPAVEVFPELIGLNDPGFWRYSWRNFVDPGLVELANVNRTASDLVTLHQNRGPYAELADLQPAAAARQLNIRTMLPTLLTGAERQYRLTSAVLSLVIAGILTIGISLAGLLGALVASRRTTEIALLRSRGASARQLSISQFSEGAVLALPAAALGLLIAALLNGSVPDAAAIGAAGAVAVAGVLALWGLTRRIWLVELGTLLGRRVDVPGGINIRRIVIEVLIVALAIGGVVLLRQRGLTTGAAREGVDPYVAAVPVLAGIATGIVALRVFPWILRQAARVAGRRPDLVPFIGLRRIAEPSLGRHLPLVVMILALGMAIFAGAIWYSIETPEPIPIEELEMQASPLMSTARAGVNEAFREGISQGFWLTMIMAAIYAGVAVICALALTSEERRRDIGYLRTLGASERQAVGLTAFEQMPSALAASLIGAAFGGALTWLLLPGLNIAGLYPPDQIMTIGVNWFIAIVQVITMLAVAVGAAFGFAVIARRSSLNDVLRVGE